MDRSIVSCFVAVLALHCADCAGAQTPSFNLNSSFESGIDAPDGWTLVAPSKSGPKAEWSAEEAHTGERSLSGESQQEAAVWTIESVGFSPNQRYIASGWIRTTSGKGWLEVVYLDAKRERLENWIQIWVPENREWTYMAVETRFDSRNEKLGEVAIVQIVFWVAGGQAFLDDLRFHPAPAPLLMNAAFEAPLDKKGRVSYWEAEKDATLAPGAMEGSYSLESGNPGEGSSSLVVSASGDWYAFTSIPYPIPAWTRRFEIEAQARAGEGSEVRMLTAWLNASQTVIRVDAGSASQAKDWTTLSSGALTPPPGTSLFRPVLLVKRIENSHGAAIGMFDDLQTRIEEEPVVRVAVNQIGYETGAPKSAILQSNFFPPGAAAKVALVDGNGASIWESEIDCDGRMYGEKETDWGWYFWRADFSDFNQEGTFRLKSDFRDFEGESFPFQIGTDLLFRETAGINVDFFFVQRCGFEVPGWHAACHLDDAKAPDGTHRDYTGGYHSAGDYNKLQWEYGDGGVMYALVSALEASPDTFKGADRDSDGTSDALDEAWWGAKYLAKIQNATGGLPNHIEQGPNRSTWMKWCPPEQMTDNKAGTEDDPIVTKGEGNSPLAIGGWARLSKRLESSGIANDYFDRAVRMWDHATKKGTANFSPLLLISTVDLYNLTKEQRYLEFCRKSVEEILKGVKPNGQLMGGYGETGDVPAAALAYFAIRLPDEALVGDIKSRLETHLPLFLSEANNALGLMMQKPGEGGYFFDPTSTMGCNYQLSSRAWSALLIYRLLEDPRALRYAMDQLDFLLGRNTESLCMMEGKGSFNLPRYHHRYLTIPGRERGAVPGAIPNGFVRDMAGNDRPGIDLSTGGRQYPSYRTNEPWLVHNVFYTLAVTALHEIYQPSR